MGLPGGSVLRASFKISRRAQLAFGCLLLFVLVGCVFFPTIHNDFVSYDDPVYITGNSHVQSGLTWESIRWAFVNLDGGFWHPLTWLSFLLDSQLFGLRPAGYHLTSLLLHATNAGLLFLVFQRLTGALWRSALVAILFALHPLQVESVAWVSERKGLLSSSFWMLALLAYAGFAEHSDAESGQSAASSARAKVCYGLTLFCYVCGLMCKTMVVSLPFILLLMDWWPLRRLQRRAIRGLILEKLPFIGAAALAGLLTIRAERQIGALTMEAQSSVAQSAANAVISYVHYIRQMAWPSGLAVHYPIQATTSSWPAAQAALGVVLVSVLVLWAARRRPYATFGWIWYLVTLLPVIGLVQIGDHIRADRYTYLPSIGIFALVTWGAHELTKQWRYQVIVLSAGALVMTSVYGTLTRRQIAYWKDSETLFRHATGVTQNSYVSETSLGVALADKGRPEEAIIRYQKALAIEPNYADAHNNLGVALASKGRWDEAISRYLKALEIEPDSADAHNNLGQALLRKGQVDEAIAHCRRAFELKPGFAGAHNNLGVALAQKGRVDEAIMHFQEALRLKPGFAEAHYDLGTALLHRGQVDEAVAHFQKALGLRAGYAEARHNLGNALVQKGQVDAAIVQFLKALEICPHFAEAHNNLGWLLLQKGQVDGAIVHLQKALEDQPDYAQAHSTLGLALLQEGQGGLAVAQFQKVLELQPTNALALNNLARVLATCPEASVRDGARAVGLAEQAERLSGGKNVTILGTLAAAYGEAGRFPEAVAAARRALQVAEAQTNAAQASSLRAQLRLYEAGFPFRNTGQTNTLAAPAQP